MSMDTRNLYDRWTKDVHAGGAYHAYHIYTRIRLADGALFFYAWQPKNGYVSMSEKAPASWEAGDILQTRPAELVV
jgi:hypothetical protein